MYKRICTCIGLNAWKRFLWLSRSCDLTSFQLLLVFCGGTLERRMFSFRIGLLHWPDKHKNKDSTGCFSWVCAILNYCSTFEMKSTFERRSDGCMMIWWGSHFYFIAIWPPNNIQNSLQRLFSCVKLKNVVGWTSSTMSHIWLLFSSKKGNSSNMENNI